MSDVAAQATGLDVDFHILHQRSQSSSSSRFTAAHAGFFDLSQSGERPERRPASRVRRNQCLHPLVPCNIVGHIGWSLTAMRPLLLVLTFCIGTSVSSAARSQPSPVLTSSGSGIFVSYDGHVLTNNHVIEDCSRLRMEQPASGAMVATVVARDLSNDLALLRTSSRP